MTKNELVWAGALEFERQHGERAAVFVAERIGALALANDPGRVERWRSIAHCLDSLISKEAAAH